MQYNIFISHSWNYSAQYENLKRLLRKASYFDFKDFSVPEDDPLTIYNKQYYKSELRNKIKNQMRTCHVVLILAGVYASYSESIQMEIEIAQELRKPIVAVEYFGSEKTSSAVKNAADKIAKWNTNSIVDAIKEVAR